MFQSCYNSSMVFQSVWLEMCLARCSVFFATLTEEKFQSNPMETFLTKLLQYHHAAMRDLVLATAHLPAPDDGLMALLSHIVAVHHNWNEKLAGTDGGLPVWQICDSAWLLGKNDSNLTESLRLLECLGHGQLIAWTSRAGDNFTHSVAEILFHVVNHASYHRGQVADRFKALGIAPVPTDYVLYGESAS